MPITKLNTFEGVPIGKENFESYTEYLSDLVARSNPFIETDASDFNEVVALGAGQEQSFAASDVATNTFVLSYVNDTHNYFAYKFKDGAVTPHTPSTITFSSTSSQDITPGSLIDGDYFVKVIVSPTSSGATTYGTFSLLVNGSDVTGESYTVSATDIEASVDFSVFESLELTASDSLSIDFTLSGGSTGLNFDVVVYKYDVWSSDAAYLINFDLSSPSFVSGLSGRVNVYYGDEINAINPSDFSNLTLIDSIAISANNDSLGSVVFKPNSSAVDGSLIFLIESGESEWAVDLAVNGFKLADDDLIHLTGNSLNSYAFFTDDDKILYAIRTRYLESPYATPGVASWEIPLGSVSEVPISPGVVGYGFSSSLMPPAHTKFSAGNFENAKTDRNVGEYAKGFMLTTINGIPQVQDDQISTSGFFNDTLLESSDVYLFNSLRLGSEYPVPRYSLEVNHQFAKPIIEGFSNVDSSVTSGESLASNNFNNTLFFPYTDFLLSPTLLLIYYNATAGSETYYYIPRDTDFSDPDFVRPNHYKVIDPSSGEVRFNFDLPSITPTVAVNDKFWIVSAEQLTESTTNNVTDYFSSYGSLYYPTANFNVTTKILSFNPNEILNVDLDTDLPELQLIPSTKIITSGGGPIISDAESEFSNLSLFGLAYPGRVDADAFVRLQANKYEPDIVKFYYYGGTVSNDIVATEVPFSTRISLVKNDVSWFNRGINDITYDPVSRAVDSELAVVLNTSGIPDDTNFVNNLKRRSSFSSFVGTIGPADTTFMNGSPVPGFAYGDVNQQISFTSASAGDLLVGTGAVPSVLAKGNSGEVLTATPTGLLWDNISTAAWTTLSVDGSDIVATDSNILSIDTSQIDASLTNVVSSTDVVTTLFLGLPSDVAFNSLIVSDSILMPETGVEAGTYGSESSVPMFTVATDGRITDASDIVISTASWKFISDGSNTNTAGAEDTLYIFGSADQIDVVADGTDTLSISFADAVVVSDSVTSPYFNFSSTSEPSPLSNGDLWVTATEIKARLNGSTETVALVGGHTHSTADITSGTFATSRGGTGQSTYSSGQLLIGNSGGTLTKATLTGDTDITITNGSGSIGVSTSATSANTINRIVKRDGSGNFSAGTISAALNGNALTATTLQTPRTINGVSFNGSANITVSANTSNTLSSGSGITSFSFNGSSAKTVSVDGTVVRTSGNQSIGGTKTFTSTISGSITGNAGTVTNGVYTNNTQTISGNKTFSGTNTFTGTLKIPIK